MSNTMTTAQVSATYFKEEVEAAIAAFKQAASASLKAAEAECEDGGLQRASNIVRDATYRAAFAAADATNVRPRAIFAALGGFDRACRQCGGGCG